MTFEDLEWGTGDALLEIFLEPTCPFSGRAFGKIRPLLELVGADQLRVKVWLQSQPWHMFSAPVCRTVLAASGLPGGKETAFSVLEAVFVHREEFILNEHRSGPNMDMSPADVVARIEALSGLPLRAAFETKDVTDAVKIHARYSRKFGIHGSPTFMVNGAVNDEMSSGDEISVWAEKLGLT